MSIKTWKWPKNELTVYGGGKLACLLSIGLGVRALLILFRQVMMCLFMAPILLLIHCWKPRWIWINKVSRTQCVVTWPNCQNTFVCAFSFLLCIPLYIYSLYCSFLTERILYFSIFSIIWSTGKDRNWGWKQVTCHILVIYSGWYHSPILMSVYIIIHWCLALLQYHVQMQAGMTRQSCNWPIYESCFRICTFY